MRSITYDPITSDLPASKAELVHNCWTTVHKINCMRCDNEKCSNVNADEKFYYKNKPYY